MTTSSLPQWVDPPPSEPGSIDPLGYLAPSDRLAEALLPGMTVLTLRARYLSFLCWAIRETGNDAQQIDRWEVALSLGEHLRHQNGTCGRGGYLGSRILSSWHGRDIPRRLHVQTARILYAGLLRSSGLLDAHGSLTDLGTKVASAFGAHIPRSL